MLNNVSVTDFRRHKGCSGDDSLFGEPSQGNREITRAKCPKREKHRRKYLNYGESKRSCEAGALHGGIESLNGGWLIWKSTGPKL